MMGIARWLGLSPASNSVSIRLPESQTYALDLFNLGRALPGGWMSRAYFSFEQRGIRYAIDFMADGCGANCTTWNASLAGAVRGQCVLAAGNRTAIEVATVAAATLVLMGVTGVSRVGDEVTITGARSLVIGPRMTKDTTVRGMWGCQRVDFGGAPSTAASYVAVNATVSAHNTGPTTAGRALGVYMISTSGARTGSLQLGFCANGPAYSTSPGQMTGVVNGIATRNGNLYFLPFAEPVAVGATASTWQLYKTNAGAGINAGARAFAATPPGNGDLIVNEQITIDTTVTDPNVAIANGSGNYTPVASLNGSVYAAVGFLFELPTAGEYVGSGHARTWVGAQFDYNFGTASTFGPTVVDGISDTPRLTTSWANYRIKGGRQGCAANSATEDFGFAFYDCSASNPAIYPFNVAPTLIAAIGAIHATPGAGYKEFTCDIPVTGVTVLGMNSVGGNVDGSIPATTITIVFTAPGAGSGWLAGWVDNGRAWDDMVVERGGLGVNSQYVTQPGGMPFGNPYGTGSPILGAIWPATFQLAPPAGGTADSTGNNHPRVAVDIEHDGMEAA